MDVSPKLLREVEFREQWRGYSQDEVDDFLERLAVALEQLQAQLQEATDRAVRADDRAREVSASDDEIRRTLVLAQRTAEAARQEAEAEAKKTLDEARAEARRLVAEARARAARIDREARDAARIELDQLIAARQALAADVDALERFIGERRAAVRSLLEESQRLLDDQSRLGGGPPPLSEVDIPDAPVTEAGAPEDDVVAEATQAHPEARPEPVEPVPPEPAGSPPLSEAIDVEPSPLDEPEANAQPEAEPLVTNGTGEPESLFEHDEDAWRDFASARDEEDDPFLAELRRAVTDPEPLGPRDHIVPEEGQSEDDVELYDQDLSSSSRFRLRRRR